MRIRRINFQTPITRAVIFAVGLLLSSCGPRPEDVDKAAAERGAKGIADFMSCGDPETEAYARAQLLAQPKTELKAWLKAHLSEAKAHQIWDQTLARCDTDAIPLEIVLDQLRAGNKVDNARLTTVGKRCATSLGSLIAKDTKLLPELLKASYDQGLSLLTTAIPKWSPEQRVALMAELGSFGPPSDSDFPSFQRRELQLLNLAKLSGQACLAQEWIARDLPRILSKPESCQSFEAPVCEEGAEALLIQWLSRTEPEKARNTVCDVEIDNRGEEYSLLHGILPTDAREQLGAKLNSLNEAIGHCQRLKRKLSSVYDRENSAETEVEEAKEDRKQYVKLWGFIIAAPEPHFYEFTFLRQTMWGPVPSGGKHAILRTRYHSYSTRGKFSLWAIRGPKIDIDTVNGFTQNWRSYIEADSDDVAAAKRRVREAKRQLSAIRKERRKLPRKLRKQRRVLSKANKAWASQLRQLKAQRSIAAK